MVRLAFEIAGSSQPPFPGPASACTGTYSLGESSQVKVKGNDTQVFGTPVPQFPVHVRRRNKSSDKTKAEKRTSSEVSPIVATPTKALFPSVQTIETETQAAHGQASEVIVVEVGKHKLFFACKFRIVIIGNLVH